jgi:hypothetical protein
MQSHNDVNGTLATEGSKGLGTIETSFFFYGNDRYAFAYIDAEIISMLHLSRGDKATQKIVTTPEGPGILILPKRFKEDV